MTGYNDNLPPGCRVLPGEARGPYQWTPEQLHRIKNAACPFCDSEDTYTADTEFEGDSCSLQRVCEHCEEAVWMFFSFTAAEPDHHNVRNLP